jgi:molybdopterin converting factor small subunit
MTFELKIRCFGITKDILSGFSHSVLINEGDSIKNLMDNLTKKYPALADLPSLRIAVNEDYQDENYIINVKDEIVLIPPVSGG